jgi:DNA polymerase-3 subunit delta
MSISKDTILQDWKKRKFNPVYWLEGEETYAIDTLTDYAEKNILTEQEASFNLTVMYGREVECAEVINSCKRYPMFADLQVVILKEAQFLKDIELLIKYIEHPLSSTVFIVAYKDKKLDGRTLLATALKKSAIVLTTKKLADYQLPEWVSQLIHTKGYLITPKALTLLVDHVGSDLSRMNNEIEKLLMNLGSRREITDEDIEKYIGVSREFNAFELQAAFAKKDMAKAIRIIEYFETNPKAAPIQMILPALYSFFSKCYMLFSFSSSDDKNAAAALGVSPYFLKDYTQANTIYTYEGIEQILMLLHAYNLKSIGINAIAVSDSSLLKELAVKIIYVRG